jgi:hypothetical protein
MTAYPATAARAGSDGNAPPFLSRTRPGALS